MIPKLTKTIGVISSIAQNQFRGPFEAVISFNRTSIRYIGEVIAVFMTCFLFAVYGAGTRHLYYYYSNIIRKTQQITNLLLF